MHPPLSLPGHPYLIQIYVCTSTEIKKLLESSQMNISNKSLQTSIVIAKNININIR